MGPHIIACHTCIALLAAVLEPAKPHSVTLLQVGHRSTRLSHSPNDLHAIEM